MDDLYNVMAQLVNLVMFQIVQVNNKPEPAAQLPPSFYAPHFNPQYPQASYNPYQSPAPRSRIPKPQMFKKYSRKQAQPVNGTPCPCCNHVNLNFAGENKRKRRSAPIDEAPAKMGAYKKYEYQIKMKWMCEGESSRTLDPLFIDVGQDCYLEATFTETGRCIIGGAEGDGTCVDPA
eukprot:TRINITY_DN776_c0_g2_i3.p1 TRINITY_DN776_c0_g2~~TRINITY_DN776_c0_g2_i3.p1  ORF type:complete len:199 (+),score=38.30 TRINITY_DN776_c0_g2_i3:67-597(+)